MATGAGGHGDQPIDTSLRGFFGMPAGGHVVKHQAAIAVHRIDHFLYRAQAGDDYGYAFLHANGQVCLQSWVSLVNDQIDRIGCGIRRQARFDFVQPGAKLAAFSQVQRREAADHAVIAAGQYQLRVGDQKHRRGHQG
jgi:hypothetical protein